MICFISLSSSGLLAPTLYSWFHSAHTVFIYKPFNFLFDPSVSVQDLYRFLFDLSVTVQDLNCFLFDLSVSVQDLYCGSMNCYDLLGVKREDDRATIAKVI